MIGALTVGKKALSFGYKRYGVPGAVASGGVVLVGYVAVRRALQAATEADEASIGAAIDAESLESAIDEDGIEAVADVRTLDEVIDREQLRSNVDVDALRSSADEELDEFAEGGDPASFDDDGDA
ncbi:hypothetical protein [Natronolimnohabitans innermongolicus]|uniref:Uncharacterized protein n=1 Tax=Natronolimnohabitans innermongolicus JCM 12255 TaxID=1227499 RepID=L9XNB5_9EURY|nr:hypothetical protein [Natronolimnohabitans innermongolicus]ELY62138.1 hypothetical protein C493_00945 [Natronolimnohabitans innermongolicus JCM 12255]